jgi:hypothetical protein
MEVHSTNPINHVSIFMWEKNLCNIDFFQTQTFFLFRKIPHTLYVHVCAMIRTSTYIGICGIFKPYL